MELDQTKADNIISAKNITSIPFSKIDYKTLTLYTLTTIPAGLVPF
jgi:hypothetical protein